jgi:hypothetical protein
MGKLIPSYELNGKDEERIKKVLGKQYKKGDIIEGGKVLYEVNLFALYAVVKEIAGEACSAITSWNRKNKNRD